MNKKGLIFRSHSITKKFGPTIALNNIDMELFSGEIRGFIGENGSGKSTMGALMTGIHEVTSGSMFYHDEEWEPKSMVHALDNGIGIIVQENGTIPQVSVAENIFLGSLEGFKGSHFFEERKVEDFSIDFDKNIYISLDNIYQEGFSKVQEVLKNGDVIFYDSKKSIKAIKKDKYLTNEEKTKLILEKKQLISKAKTNINENKLDLKSLRLNYQNQLFEEYKKAHEILLKQNEDKLANYIAEYNKQAKEIYNQYQANLSKIKEENQKLVDIEVKYQKRRYQNDVLEEGKKYAKKIKGLDNSFELFRRILATDERSLKNRYLNYVNNIYKKNENSFSIKFKKFLLELVFGQFVNRRKLNKYAQLALNKIGVNHINAAIPCGAYDMQDRKLIEIAKTLNKNPEIFIVDETTTSLSEIGRNIIYKQMEKLRDEGKTVLFISHDLDEIKEHCDTLTVLRDGNIVATLTKSKNEFVDEDILRAMIGRDLNGAYYREDYDGSYSDEVVLKMIDGIESNKLKNVNVELHRGEILGVGGLSECGMRELGQALFGNIKMEGGFVYAGEDLKNLITNEVTAMKNKIGYLPKNRDIQGLSQKDTIFSNIALASINNLAKLNFFIFKGSERQVVNKQMVDLSIKANSSQDLISTLSGGNKQKVSLAKWIGNNSEILILDNPTRGVDIGVKQFIYQLMYQMKLEGKSILMISEELPELIGMSDRILIMKDGKINKEFTRSEDLTQEQIVKYMI